MRISDWSSDVCSSDLPAQCEQQHAPPPEMVGEIAEDGRGEKGRDRHDEADPRADLDRVRQVEFADLHHQLRLHRHDDAEAARVHANRLDDDCNWARRRHFCFSFVRLEEHTSELQSLMRISYAVFYLTKTTH